MENKLLKELKKKKEKNNLLTNKNEIIQEVNQFLLESHKEDERILHNIGLDHNLEYQQKLVEDINRNKVSIKIYKKISFSGKEIKELCKRYDLKMLRAQYYNGKIPADLTRKLKEFEKETGTNLTDSDNFFILAPTEQFKNIKHVPRQQDPILFYRTEISPNRYGEATESDFFVAVHNWGDDFSFLRKYKRLFNTYEPDTDTPTDLTVTLGLSFFYLLLFLISVIAHYFITSIVITVLYIVFLYLHFSEPQTEELWNKNRI